MTDVANYLHEFPEYDDKLPDLAPFADASWRNETMPRFEYCSPNDPDLAKCKIALFCDFKDPEMREALSPKIKRFQLVLLDAETDAFVGSVLTAETIADLRETCNVWYLDKVGYRRDDDGDGPLALGQLLLEVGQMAFFHGVSDDAGASTPTSC